MIAGSDGSRSSLNFKRDSPMSKVTGYGLEDRSSIPVKDSDFCLPYSASHAMGTGG
jgi:hypothetical protein